MVICANHGFTFLAMTKCASTSIERALYPLSSLRTAGKNIGLKHMKYRTYEKYMSPLMQEVTGGDDLEVLCLMRDPISWNHSWYKYRQRDVLKGTSKFTGNITFNEYCEGYMKQDTAPYLVNGKQSDFFKNSKGNIGNVKIFRYEEIDIFIKYIEKKINSKLNIPKLNVSPVLDIDLDSEIEKKLRNYLKYDYEIYNSLKNYS